MVCIKSGTETSFLPPQKAFKNLFNSFDSFFLYIKIKNLQILHLHSIVPSIVKKDLRSPSLHFGWHSQLKLIFSKQNKDQNYKAKIHDMTDYRTTEPRQIAGQGKEKKN